MQSLVLELIKAFPSLSPPERVVAAELMKLLSGGSPATHSAEHAPPAPPLKHNHPDAIFVKKGQKFLSRWKAPVLRALDAPLSREDLCLAVKSTVGTCLPPYAMSHLLHALWARNLVSMTYEATEDFPKGRAMWVVAPAGKTQKSEPASEPKVAAPPPSPPPAPPKPQTPNEWMEWLAERLAEKPDRTIPVTDAKRLAHSQFGVEPDLLEMGKNATERYGVLPGKGDDLYFGRYVFRLHSPSESSV